jgi:hypothetical protein
LLEARLKERNIKNKNPIALALGFSDVPGRIRTSDLLIRSQPLYPAELRALAGRLSKARQILPKPKRLVKPFSVVSFDT